MAEAEECGIPLTQERIYEILSSQHCCKKFSREKISRVSCVLNKIVKKLKKPVL